LRLRRTAAHAGDEQRTWAAPLAHRSSRELENGFQETNRRITNGELRSVNADGDATGPGVAVVPRERDLAAFVKPTRCGEGERVRGNDETAEKSVAKVSQSSVRIGHP
jgi:hypothetical protein